MTWWDCVWKVESCLTCYYWHRMVQQDEQPVCPRGLKPKWRMLFDRNEMEKKKGKK